MSRQKWTTPAGHRYTLYADMLEQPHLLVAGATGSGKSVVVNALIYTALFRFPHGAESRNSAGLILIDPKRVELVDYKDLPHTLRYASEPAEMVQALQYAMELTEDRYRTMQRQRAKKWDGGQLYVIIDEFADLMTTNRKQVQPLIQRLAQIGRAAGVHIILATQCPLANVIPTEIKVNFDAILGLRTATKAHSRNIVDVPCCETFPDPRTERKAFGAYRKGANLDIYNLPMIPDEELSARVRFWMDQKPCRLFSRLFGRCA